jgi:quinolinate synthase
MMTRAIVEPLPSLAQYRRLPPEEALERARKAREALGANVVLLAHHYQVDEIVALADHRGDSLELSRLAAAEHRAEYIVFCGVDFMAESAAILCSPKQKVILPAGDAPCPMAAMVDVPALRFAWEFLESLWGRGAVVPLAYQNSSAAVKAFCGEHGGAVCTSSNAEAALRWALGQGKRVLFVPDQYLAINSALALGYRKEEIALWRRHEDRLDARGDVQQVAVVAWDGYCHVHLRFQPEDIVAVRQRHPGIRVIVHPECTPEVVSLADAAGSTSYIVKAVEQAPAGSSFAIGTETHLVHRLAREHPNKLIVPLRHSTCVTMARTDVYNLCWALENLLAGNPVNVVSVPPPVIAGARAALERMLQIR